MAVSADSVLRLLDLRERVRGEPLAAGARRRAAIIRAIGGARRECIGILGRAGRDALVTPYRDDGAWQLRVPCGAWPDAGTRGKQGRAPA